jgi:hypothetical protein
MLTISTNKDGDIDQTNEEFESSVFPVGFHDKVLFSGRTLPFRVNYNEPIEAFTGKYATSHANYVNLALTDLCFQMYAEVADVDELLEMIRSTSLTDYIRFDLNGDGDTNDTIDGQPETQPLQLINPAGFYKKYLIPKSIPSSLSLGETLELEKGYYKGVIFNIPGAEVNIGDEWIPFTAENASRIKAANPMNLEWRLNGTLLRKYGYSSGQTLQGKIITVDDQWNGLRLEKDFTIQIN